MSKWRGAINLSNHPSWNIEGIYRQAWNGMVALAMWERQQECLSALNLSINIWIILRVIISGPLLVLNRYIVDKLKPPREERVNDERRAKLKQYYKVIKTASV